MTYYTGMGDYYSGKGDPGLFSALGSLGRGITGFAGKFLPGPAGAIAKVAHRALGGRPTTGTRPVPGPRMPVSMTPVTGGLPIPRIPSFGPQVPSAPAAMGGACASNGCAPGYHLDKTEGVKCVRNRRTNYTNPRALSRAAKRLDGFVGVARKALKTTNYKVVSKSYKQNWRKPLKK